MENVSLGNNYESSSAGRDGEASGSRVQTPTQFATELAHASQATNTAKEDPPLSSRPQQSSEGMNYQAPPPPGNNPPIPNEPLSDDEEGDELEPEHTSEEKLSIKKMPKFGWFMIDLLLAFTMLVPFFCLYWVKSFPVYNITIVKGPDFVLNPYMEFFRWSVFMSFAYASYSILDFVLGALPTHTLDLLNKLNLLKSKRVRRHVGYLRNIHPYFTMTIFFLFLLWLGGIVVYNRDSSNTAVKVGPLGGAKSSVPLGATISIDPFMQDPRYYVERFLLFAAILAGVIAFEKYLLEAIRAKFHRMALATRIRDINYRQSIIRTLYQSITRGQPHILSSRRGSGAHVGGDIYLEFDPVINLNSLSRARSIASALFAGLCTSSRNIVVKEDMSKHLPAEDLDNAFRVLDADNNGSIDENEMKAALEDLFEDIQNIKNSLQGNARIVNKLDTLMLVIACLVGFALAVPFLDIGFAQAWATFGLVTTAFGFMFQNAAKTCFEALIFVFVEHAFDVGDRVSVDGENMIVQNIEIFTTRLIRWDGIVVYAPNSVLSGKYIYNVRRSGQQSDIIQVDIDAKTTTEQLHEILKKAKEWTAGQPKDFSGFIDIADFSVKDEARMEVKFTVRYKSNFQNQAIRNARKTKFLMAMKQILVDLDISYFPPA